MQIPLCSIVLVAAKYDNVTIVGFDRQKLRRLGRIRDRLMRRMYAYRHFNKNKQWRLLKKSLMTYREIERLEEQVESCRIPQDFQSQLKQEFADAQRCRFTI